MTSPPPSQIDLAQASPVQPPRAPVQETLTGREKAGVQLTWGVLGLITVFLAFMLIIHSCHEARVDRALSTALTSGQGVVDTVRFRLFAAERAAFRDQWKDTVQLVLLNVLLPVLTGLLGYVFGTAARSARND